MRSFLTMCAVAAICCGVAAPAQAGGGGGGSKSNVTVKVKNVGEEAFGAAVQSGSKSSFPTKPSAYKELAPDDVANFKVKSGTFTLFGVVIEDDEPVAAIGPQGFTTSGKTTFIEADSIEGIATKVSSF